jgi:hypothetical protein
MTELYTRVYFFRNVQLIWNRVPVTGSISLSLSFKDMQDALLLSTTSFGEGSSNIRRMRYNDIS